jgi:hypothetical protein
VKHAQHALARAKYGMASAGTKLPGFVKHAQHALARAKYGMPEAASPRYRGAMPRALLVGSLLLAGCDDTLFGYVPPGTVPADYTPTWTGVEALMRDQCVSCHASGNPVILPADVEQDLVDGNHFLVTPGDPEGSLLWRVLSDTQQLGETGPMPYLSGPLEPQVVLHVKTWIETGCPIPGVYPSEGDTDLPADTDDSDVPADTDTDAP